MNRERRKTLKEIKEKLQNTTDLLEELKKQIEDVRAEEKEALDNMPKRLQESQKDYDKQDNNDYLYGVYEGLETASNDIYNSIYNIKVLIGECKR